MCYLEYFGVCTTDDKNDRILSEYFEENENMTIEMCLSICRERGYPFSGLEWSCECHCGYEPEDGFEWAWSSKCDDRCSGDSNQVCGGSSALRSVFRLMMLSGGLIMTSSDEHYLKTV